MARTMLVAGNWKMNGIAADLAEARAIAEGVRRSPAVEVALCLPASLIERAARLLPGFSIGGQDSHAAAAGAYTGDISAVMLKDAGASLTIVGHSERREAHGESDAEVRAKAITALDAGLDVILCVGESLAVRERGEAVATVSSQLADSLPDQISGLTIAYEPIWAIGTGKIPSLGDIEEMHCALRCQLLASLGEGAEQVRILYGGSVKGSNAAEIFAIADVDGALVGGASLKSVDFLPIIAVAASI